MSESSSPLRVETAGALVDQKAAISELRACPFCGGADIEVVELGYNALGQATCGGCGAMGPVAEKTVAAARDAWNRRPAQRGD